MAVMGEKEVEKHGKTGYETGFQESSRIERRSRKFNFGGQMFGRRDRGQGLGHILLLLILLAANIGKSPLNSLRLRDSTFSTFFR